MGRNPWVPAPAVAAAREVARKIGGNRAIVLVFTEAGSVTLASYGATKTLCDELKPVADAAFDAVMDYFQKRDAK